MIQVLSNFGNYEFVSQQSLIPFLPCCAMSILIETFHNAESFVNNLTVVATLHLPITKYIGIYLSHVFLLLKY